VTPATSRLLNTERLTAMERTWVRALTTTWILKCQRPQWMQIGMTSDHSDQLLVHPESSSPQRVMELLSLLGLVF